ncbi:methyl-accepting chemotaxis protein [Ferrimonas pelagia]
MRSISLKYKITGAIGALLFISVTAIISWAYHADKRNFTDTLDHTIDALGDQYIGSVSGWLDSRRDIITALANHLGDAPLTQLQLSQQAGQFNLTYFGRNDGAMFDSDPSIDRTGYDPRQRPWYHQAMTSSGMVLTPPYLDVAYNQTVITLATQVHGGVVGADLTLDTLMSDIRQFALPGEGQAMLIDGNGIIIAHPQNHLQQQPLTQLDASLSPRRLAPLVGNDRVNFWQFEHGATMGVWLDAIPGTDWQLLVMLDEKALLAPLMRQTITQLPFIYVSLALVLALITYLTHILLTPLRQVSAALGQIADGDGDLTQRIAVDHRDEVGQLAEHFNRYVAGLATFMGQLRDVAVDVDQQADNTTASNRDADLALQQQQCQLTQLATAITQMTQSTQEIARHAEQTASAAQQSSQSSEQGKALVNRSGQAVANLAGEIGEATHVVDQLNEHAQAISSILTTIQNIAEQTNLLALNAAIEAARAGEQGRGFAVVADEVRLLSQRTQQSTEEIQSTIETLQSTTHQAVSQMRSSRAQADNSVQATEEANAALSEITDAIALISDMAIQIATAVEEQTQVAAEIHHNTNAVADVSRELAGQSDLRQQRSEVLKQRADELNAEIGRFKL